jgi:hypothetical protein
MDMGLMFSMEINDKQNASSVPMGIGGCKEYALFEDNDVNIIGWM